MTGAFTGKYLRVNLTQGTTEVEQFSDVQYRMFMGGASMAAFILARELKPGVDPLGPDNVLVFSTCPLNGIALSGTTRFTVAAKSPLTGGYGEGEAGGWWAPELKFAGFDGIIVTGQSPRLVYLWITDGKAEIRDGAHLSGKLSGEVQDILIAATDKRARILQCGPAGERGNLHANIVNELKHFNGRCGLGAVMGSKRLRAIAVRGHERVEPKNPEAMQAVVKRFHELYDRDTDSLRKFGTARGVMPLNADGMLPTRNFREGQFEHAKAISGQTMAETIVVDKGTCYACMIACKREVEVPELGVISRYGGPEYETIASGGSLCGVADLKVIAKFNQLCAEYVLDTISVGATIAFAMECFEEGVLTTADTDGLELRFGNGDALLVLTEKIGKREGLGDLLALGSDRAAQKIGRGAERFVLTVKKQEIAMHEARGKQALSLQYATAPGGADHMRAPHDPWYEAFNPHGMHPLEPLGLCEPVKRLELSPQKVRAYHYASHYWIMVSCVGICQLASVPPNVLGMTAITDAMRAVTGWDTSLWELLKVAERAKALTRVLNCREGFTAKDDRLPQRLHEALASGPLQGVRIAPDTFVRALRLYHQMEGWDPDTGWPTFAKLAELGIEWAARPGETW